jgi:hypothetical protein
MRRWVGQIFSYCLLPICLCGSPCTCASGACACRSCSGCRSCTGSCGACARRFPCRSPCTGSAGARACTWAWAWASDHDALLHLEALLHHTDHLPETQQNVSSHWHPVDLPTSPTKLRANSGTGATPVVSPVLQPWTSCAKRKSQHGKASAYGLSNMYPLTLLLLKPQ